MAKKEPELTTKNRKRARKILVEVVDLLEKNNIEYYLEGGTLLGIVRDKDLLPWDHDVDISIPSEYAESFLKLKRKLLYIGYKISVRRSLENFGPIETGSYSVIKVKPIFLYLFDIFYPKAKENLIVLDVFIKASDEQYTYWQAKGRVMRVEKIYYSSYESVSAFGKKFRAPYNYKEYLTQKYGNWSIPIKEWDCRHNEKTICGSISSKAYPIK